MIDFERYGGKRSFLTHLTEFCKESAGFYAHLRRIDWSSVNRLVFICKGNICRSPYAEARARSLGLNAISLGFEASAGASANPMASSEALLHEIDLSEHRSRRMTPAQVAVGDLAVFFEPDHLRRFTSLMGVDNPAAVSLLGLWAQPRRPFISDPYGKSQRYFQECFSVIDSSVAAISHLLKRG
jgi:protein-tyrosine phosphatase